MSQQPDWLNQVQQFDVTSAQAEGKSETGAVLASVADAIDAEGDEPFAKGEVMGAVIDRGTAGTEFAVMVSSGKADADVAELAAKYGVTVQDVSLMSAAVMLDEQYQGVATCSTFF